MCVCVCVLGNCGFVNTKLPSLRIKVINNPKLFVASPKNSDVKMSLRNFEVSVIDLIINILFMNGRG